MEIWIEPLDGGLAGEEERSRKGEKRDGKVILTIMILRLVFRM